MKVELEVSRDFEEPVENGVSKGCVHYAHFRGPLGAIPDGDVVDIHRTTWYG